MIRKHQQRMVWGAYIVYVGVSYFQHDDVIHRSQDQQRLMHCFNNELACIDATQYALNLFFPVVKTNFAYPVSSKQKMAIQLSLDNVTYGSCRYQPLVECVMLIPYSCLHLHVWLTMFTTPEITRHAKSKTSKESRILFHFQIISSCAKALAATIFFVTSRTVVDR